MPNKRRYMMQNIKLYTLNFICIVLLAYFMVLAWQRVIVSTPYFDNDYKTFYSALRSDRNIYHPDYYFHVIGLKEYKDNTLSDCHSRNCLRLSGISRVRADRMDSRRHEDVGGNDRQ